MMDSANLALLMAVCRSNSANVSLNLSLEMASCRLSSLNFNCQAALDWARSNSQAAASWGRDIALAQDTIRQDYGASHQHDAGSIAAIMGELRKADAIRNHKLAPPPDTNGLANSVVRKLLFDDNSSKEGTPATGKGYSSDTASNADSKVGGSKASHQAKSMLRK